MVSDYFLELQEEEHNEAGEIFIKAWIQNGATEYDAIALWHDMHSPHIDGEDGIIHHFDTTVEERLNKYSSPPCLNKTTLQYCSLRKKWISDSIKYIEGESIELF